MLLTVTDADAQYYATESLVRLQLAEGFYMHVTGPSVADREQESELKVTAEQDAAATFCGAPALVDAGPGTGKTKTLVRRVIYLLQERHVPPENMPRFYPSAKPLEGGRSPPPRLNTR